jgi:hypothetical protein
MELEDMAHKLALPLSLQTLRSVPFVVLRQSPPSQIALISPSVDQLMRFIAKCRNQKDSGLKIEMALREALANAIVHLRLSSRNHLPMRHAPEQYSGRHAPGSALRAHRR